MGIKEAQKMITGLQGQIGSGQIAGQAISGLDQAGLGAINPRRFFSTPTDESFLRSAVLGQVLGRFGAGPLPMPGEGTTDKFTGGYSGPILGGGLLPPGPPQIGGEFTDIGRAGEGTITRGGAPLYQAPSRDDIFTRFGGRIPTTSDTQSQLPVGSQIGGSLPIQGAGGTTPGIVFSAPIDQVINPGAAGLSMTGQDLTGLQVRQGGLPQLDAGTRQALDAMTQTQVDTLNRDFGSQRQDLLNNLFGRGINNSTIAADAGGRLLFGRQDALNQITGQAAERELGLRQQLFQAELEKAKSRGILGGGGGGGFGGTLSGIAKDTSSLDPLTFEQKLQLEELGLKQAELAQQGSLGGRELDIRQLLGLGDMGLRGQGMDQDLLQFILGQGLQRQQGAAGLRSQDLGRLTDYAQGITGIQAGLTQQQAQQEAARRGILGQILGGVASIGGSILGGPLGGALGGSLFGGTKPPGT